MATPLPSPASLLTALNALERAISTYEKSRESVFFSRSSTDFQVEVIVNGLGRVTSVTIGSSQLALGAVALAAKVQWVANQAIDAAYAATAATIASFASGLSLPGLPAYGSLPPDYLDFVPTANAIEADILANDPCDST